MYLWMKVCYFFTCNHKSSLIYRYLHHRFTINVYLYSCLSFSLCEFPLFSFHSWPHSIFFIHCPLPYVVTHVFPFFPIYFLSSLTLVLIFSPTSCSCFSVSFPAIPVSFDVSLALTFTLPFPHRNLSLPDSASLFSSLVSPLYTSLSSPGLYGGSASAGWHPDWGAGWGVLWQAEW